ncbi:MAG: hypothetical protein WC394_05275 [Candidatus Omnitrophota bacterium]|jgi:hypothetical protein
MKCYSDYFSSLVPYKEFNPNAFVGDKDIPQDLCNFILALALAYNDYKYYTMNFIMLIESQPKCDIRRDSKWGEFSGIKLHIIRLHIGFVHELFQLIKNNKNLLAHQFFKEIVRVLNKEARKSWGILVEAALAKEVTPKKSNPLFMIRNKVSFHYDPKELHAGYNKGFFKEGKISQNACVSEGSVLWGSRFYFADLAIQGYLEKELGPDADAFFASLNQIMAEINMALHNICIRFIQRRNFAWKYPNK